MGASATPPEPPPVLGPEPPLPPDPAPLELPTMRVMVPRWIQLVVLPLAILGLWALARAAGPVLLLFLVAALVALLLNPLVTVLRRRRWLPRGIAVAVVYLGLLAALAGIGILAANPIADQVNALRDQIPQLVHDANRDLADVQHWLDRKHIKIQIAAPGRTALQSVGDNLTRGSDQLVNVTRDALQIIVEGALALILVLVLSVYMLIYGERIGAGVRRMIPTGDGSPEDDFPTRMQAAVAGYVRGQLLFSLVMGTSAGLVCFFAGKAGLFEKGDDYALAFGVFFGIAELIPYVGPAIGAAPPLLVCLFTQGTGDTLILAALFTLLQQLEGHVVAPNVFASALRINPLLVIFALLMGGRLYGFAGAFVALPTAALLRETWVYFRRHLVLEPWGGAAPPLALAGAGLTECPECGTELADADTAAAAGSAAAS